MNLEHQKVQEQVFSLIIGLPLLPEDIGAVICNNSPFFKSFLIDETTPSEIEFSKPKGLPTTNMFSPALTPLLEILKKGIAWLLVFLILNVIISDVLLAVTISSISNIVPFFICMDAFVISKLKMYKKWQC